jgi:hypothetical protein
MYVCMCVCLCAHVHVCVCVCVCVCACVQRPGRHTNTSREAEGQKGRKYHHQVLSPFIPSCNTHVRTVHQHLNVFSSMCLRVRVCVCAIDIHTHIYTHNVRHTARSICAIVHVCTIPSWDKAQPVRDTSRADPGSNPVEVVVEATMLSRPTPWRGTPANFRDTPDLQCLRQRTATHN